MLSPVSSSCHKSSSFWNRISRMESVEVAVSVLLCALVLISGTNTELIRVKPIFHGTKGKPLHLPVETDFGMKGVHFQGIWYQTSPRLEHLVTFTTNSSILAAPLQKILVLRPPDISLFFKTLDDAAEGEYQLNIHIFFPGQPNAVDVIKTTRITVNVPLSTPVVEKSSEAPLVEDRDNITLTCTVENGAKANYQWLRNSQLVSPSERHVFMENKSTLLIHPVKKEDMGTYSCMVENHISKSNSPSMDLTVFYGPYNLEVNTNQGQKIGEVFTVNQGEPVFFDCLADSNPPNSCVWISRNNNNTEVLMIGPRWEVPSYKLAQPTKFLCRAFNNITQMQDETHFTLVVAASIGREKHTQGESTVHPLAVLTITSLLIIICMLFVFFRRACHPKRVLMKIYNRPIPEQKGLHRSGHEDATEDFGIYEFVSLPGKMESAQASNRSLAPLGSVRDLHTTIYEVIRHVPETPTLSLLK